MAAAKKEAKLADDDEKDAKKDGGAEGEEGAEGGEGGEELPKKKIAGKKLVLFIVVGVLLLGSLVGGGLYFTGIIGGHKTEEEHKEPEHKEAPVYFELPLSPINLQSEPGARTPSFLRLKVTLELSKEEDKQAVTDSVPRIVDSFQMYLRELTKGELQGSAGLERLREELRLRVNAAVAPVEIKDVLFTEMLFGR